MDFFVCLVHVKIVKSVQKRYVLLRHLLTTFKGFAHLKPTGLEECGICIFG